LLAREDKYFEDRGDVLAVFDYDQEVIHQETKILVYILCTGFLTCLTVVSIVPFVPFPFPGFLLLFGSPIMGYLIGKIIAKVLRKTGAAAVPHTAVTESGLRHVQPANKSISHRGYTLFIPFHDIQAIEVSSLHVLSIRTPSVDMGEIR
jgi:hypothetical protein